MQSDGVTAVRAEIGDLAERVGSLEALREEVRALADEMLGELQPEQADGEPIATVTWLDLTTDEAQKVFGELWVWMDTVLVHQARVMELLRPCWYRHPAVVQALLDNRTAWLLAYRNPKGNGAVRSALDWTHRHVPDLERFLSRELARCTNTRHDPERVPLPRVDAQDARTYLEWWGGSRDPSTEPPPLGTTP